MFCTSLRKRPEWALIIPKLLASQTPRWTGKLTSSNNFGHVSLSVTVEKTLGTHDIAIPLPQRGDQGSRVWMLLLSALDMQSSADGLARIERLYHLNGGHHVALVFLVDNNNQGVKADGVKAYMELQAR